MVIVLSQGLDYLIQQNIPGVIEVQLLFAPFNLLRYLLSILSVCMGLVIIIETILILLRTSEVLPFAPFLHDSVPPTELLHSQWFSVVRHPMLLGYLLILAGLGLYLNLVSMTFWWVPLIGMVGLQYVLYIEEPRLVQWFGKPYRNYQNRVPALIPRIKIVHN